MFDYSLDLVAIDDTLINFLRHFINIRHLHFLVAVIVSFGTFWWGGKLFITLILSNFINLITDLSLWLRHVFQLFFLICYLVIEDGNKLILLSKFLLNLINYFDMLIHLLGTHILLLRKLLALSHGLLNLLLHLHFLISLFL